jgi:hypothetical protein
MKAESKSAVSSAEKRARIDVIKESDCAGKAVAHWKNAERVVRQRADTLVTSMRSPGRQQPHLPELLVQLHALRNARRESSALLQKANQANAKLVAAKTRHDGLTKHLAEAAQHRNRQQMGREEDVSAELWSLSSPPAPTSNLRSAEIQTLGEQPSLRPEPHEPDTLIGLDSCVARSPSLFSTSTTPNQRAEQPTLVDHIAPPVPVDISLTRTPEGGVTVKVDTRGITILPDGRGGVVVESPGKFRLDPVMAAGLAQSGVRFSLRQGRHRR